MMHLVVVSVGKTLLHSSAMHERRRRKWDENGPRSARFALLMIAHTGHFQQHSVATRASPLIAASGVCHLVA